MGKSNKYENGNKYIFLKDTEESEKESTKPKILFLKREIELENKPIENNGKTNKWTKKQTFAYCNLQLQWGGPQYFAMVNFLC